MLAAFPDAYQKRPSRCALGAALPRLRSRRKVRQFGPRSHGVLVCCSWSEGGPENHQLLRPRLSPGWARPATLTFLTLRSPASSHLCSFPASQPEPAVLLSLLLKTTTEGDVLKRKAPAASRLRHSLDGWAVSRPLSVPCSTAGSSACVSGRWALLGWPGRGSEQPLLSLLGSGAVFLEWRR